MSNFDPTNYWNPSPRNLNRMSNKTQEEPRAPSPGPSRPQVASSSTAPGMGRPAIPSPLGIYGRLSPRPLLSPEAEEDALSDASKDSFDWIGDDQQQMAGEDYEEILLEQLNAKPLTSTQAPAREKGGFPSSMWTALPVNFIHNILLLIFLLCTIVYIAKLVQVPMPHIGKVPLDRWILMVFLAVFTPVWVNAGILRFARFLHSTGALSKTEVSGRLEEMRYSITLCISALLVGTIWMSLFSASCAPVVPPTPGTLTVTGEAVAEVASSSGKDDLLVAPICYYEYVPRLFFFLFVAGLVTALDGLLMSIIKSSFQEKNFKNRIVENRFKVFVIDQLLLAAKQERLARQVQRQDVTATTLASKNVIDTGTGRQQRSVVVRDFMFNLPFLVVEQARRYYRRWFGSGSSGTYRQVAGQAGTTSSPIHVLSGEFGDFKRELLQTIQEAGYESVAKAPPRTDLEGKIMARMIFHYLCPADRNQLTQEDFAVIISNETACRDAYNVFDYDKDGSISKSEFRSAVIRIFREQRNLAQSVANTGSALSVLDTISMWVVSAGLFLLALALLGVRVQSILAVTASVVLGLNFVIFDGANKTFGAILFVFVMHPYDVGDRIVIGRDVNSEEDVLTVMEINIQNTVFKKWNGLIISTPNHVLAGGPITSLSRASEQWERVEFELYAPDQMKLTVDEETENLADLRRRIDAFVRQYHQDYYQAFELRAVIAADTAKADKNLDKLRFALKIRCRETIDSEKKWIRHARILAFVKQAVQHSGVEFAANAA